MKALVLAGGTGTRLRPFSHTMPKQLIPVANKPVLVHILEDIRAQGISEVGIVVGGHAADMAETLGDGSALGLRITYLHQDAPRGLAHCVVVARDFLGDADFVMYLGDNMLPQGIAPVVDDFRAGGAPAQLAVQSVADPRAFGVAELGEGRRVRRVVEKPVRPVSDLALIGVYVFSPQVHDAVAAITPSARGELEITDAVQWLITQGHEVRASCYEGYWRDMGTVDDVLECNRELLRSLTTSVQGRVDGASLLVGPVEIGEGSSVTNSRITGPVSIGRGVVIKDSCVGPDTTVGDHCTLSGAGVSYSIVLEAASISDVEDLHGSVIGRAAQIASAGVSGRHHRLMVGDHASVHMLTSR
ncbi:glucose-1-phosphate thymidylyltransferase [Streptomyces spiroverticillatus]|uniref:Glucose-1-phosphate thymidylyltransferase n=1 Tax=Streptomyces finlayi TaxID=67296 RepID=A0A918X801_9ACTN|nr:glucose-1-phosphate thymidylyltransferase [Streptomyces finlayi]GHA44117.1 glucose-1-phosphate thymidylyltransferase [Streptomyces spiroverticillatus]GHD17637.1 glucose-1-phosphate thymidylyltransferase [Streptomyces finlayi]